MLAGCSSLRFAGKWPTHAHTRGLGKLQTLVPPAAGIKLWPRSRARCQRWAPRSRWSPPVAGFLEHAPFQPSGWDSERDDAERELRKDLARRQDGLQRSADSWGQTYWLALFYTPLSVCSPLVLPRSPSPARSPSVCTVSPTPLPPPNALDALGLYPRGCKVPVCLQVLHSPSVGVSAEACSSLPPLFSPVRFVSLDILFTTSSFSYCPLLYWKGPWGDALEGIDTLSFHIPLHFSAYSSPNLHFF